MSAYFPDISLEKHLEHSAVLGRRNDRRYCLKKRLMKFLREYINPVSKIYAKRVSESLQFF